MCDDADDLKRSGFRVAGPAELDLPANRVLTRPECLGEGFIYDTDKQRIAVILFRKEPAAEQPHSHRSEVVRADAINVGRRHLSRRWLRSSLDGKCGLPPSQQGKGRSRILHTWQRLGLLDHLIDKHPDLCGFVVLGL